MHYVIDEIANQLAGFFEARERVQTVYSRNEQTDLTVPALFLDRYAIEPEIQTDNGYITFSCGTKISAIIKALGNTPYSPAPFDSLDKDQCIGKYFTHDTMFSSDVLVSITAVLPDGRVLALGKNAYTSVAGYSAMNLFIGTRNLLGIPAIFVYKLQNRNYSRPSPVDELSGEDRKIVLRLKSIYDPYHILNTFHL